MTVSGIMVLAGLAIFPIAVLIWFILSLLKFKRTPKSDPAYNRRRILLLVSGVFLFWLISSGAMIACVVLLAMSGV